MSRKQKIQTLFIAILLTSFLFAFKSIWKQEKMQIPKLSKKESKKNISTKVESCMKPAWYRFFIPQTNTNPQISLEKSKLYFLVKEDAQQPNFLNITLINKTDNNILFPTQNRSLLMIQEAKDKNGNWKAIEYWNKDWQMGTNSQENFVLKKNKSIFCTAPKYTGDFETKVRFKLKIIEADNFDQKIIYSPEFSGNIHLGQFSINWEEESRLKPENVSYLDE